MSDRDALPADLGNDRPKSTQVGSSALKGDAASGNPRPGRDDPQKAAAPRISIGSWHMPLPQSKWLRVTIGCLLVVFGCLGFLPILGFWMVPLGLVVLSHDSSYIRRKRRRMAVWWGRRRQASRAKAEQSATRAEA